jgi:mRNA interferase MazF
MRNYVPKRGDVVWLSFSPQSGHEQAGRRPGLVISPEDYNGKTGLALMCPITSRKKGYPFEVDVSAPVTGVILSDQLRNLDWKTRTAEKIGEVEPEVLAEVVGKLLTLVVDDSAV